MPIDYNNKKIIPNSADEDTKMKTTLDRIIARLPSLDGQGGKVLVVSENEEGAEWRAVAGVTHDYRDLTYKPKINGVELNGNKISPDLKLLGETDIQTIKNKTFVVNDGALGDGNTLEGIEGTNFKNQGAVSANKVWGIDATGATTLLAQSGGSAVYETGTYVSATNTVTFTNTIPSIIAQVVSGSDVVLRVQMTDTITTTGDFRFVGKEDNGTIIAYVFGLFMDNIIQRCIYLWSTDTGNATNRVYMYTPTGVTYCYGNIVMLSGALTVRFNCSIPSIRSYVNDGKNVRLCLLDISVAGDEIWKEYSLVLKGNTPNPDYLFIHSKDGKQSIITLKSTDIGTNTTDIVNTDLLGVSEPATISGGDITFTRSISAIVADVFAGKNIVINAVQGTTTNQYYLVNKEDIAGGSKSCTFVCTSGNLSESSVLLKNTDSTQTTNISTCSNHDIITITGTLSSGTITFTHTIPSIISQVNTGETVILKIESTDSGTTATENYGFCGKLDDGTDQSYIFACVREGIVQKTVTLLSTDSGSTTTNISTHYGSGITYVTGNYLSSTILFSEHINVFLGWVASGKDVAILINDYTVTPNKVRVFRYDTKTANATSGYDYSFSSSDNNEIRRIVLNSEDTSQAISDITIETKQLVYYTGEINGANCDLNVNISTIISRINAGKEVILNVSLFGLSETQRFMLTDIKTDAGVTKYLFTCVYDEDKSAVIRLKSSDTGSSTTDFDYYYGATLDTAVNMYKTPVADAIRTQLLQMVANGVTKVFTDVTFPTSERPSGTPTNEHYCVYVNRLSATQCTMVAYQVDKSAIYKTSYDSNTSAWRSWEDISSGTGSGAVYHAGTLTYSGTIPTVTFTDEIPTIFQDVSDGKFVILKIEYNNGVNTFDYDYYPARINSGSVQFLRFDNNRKIFSLLISSTDTGHTTNNLYEYEDNKMIIVSGNRSGNTVTLSGTTTIQDVITMIGANKDVVLDITTMDLVTMVATTRRYYLEDRVDKMTMPTVQERVFVNIDGDSKSTITLTNSDSGQSTNNVVDYTLQSELLAIRGTARQVLARNSTNDAMEYVTLPEGVIVYDGALMIGGVEFTEDLTTIYANLAAGKYVMLRILGILVDKSIYFSLDKTYIDSTTVPTSTKYVLSAIHENRRYSVEISSLDSGTTSALPTSETVQADIVSTVYGTANQVLALNGVGSGLEFVDQSHPVTICEGVYNSGTIVFNELVSSITDKIDAGEDVVLKVSGLLSVDSIYFRLRLYSENSGVSPTVKYYKYSAEDGATTYNVTLASNNATTSTSQFTTQKVQADILTNVEGSAYQALCRNSDNNGLEFASVPRVVSPTGMFSRESLFAAVTENKSVRVFESVYFSASESPSGNYADEWIVYVNKGNGNVGTMTAYPVFRREVYHCTNAYGTFTAWCSDVISDQSLPLAIHKCTKAEYDAITTKDTNTLYHITDDSATSDVYTKTEIDTRFNPVEIPVTTTSLLTGGTIKVYKSGNVIHVDLLGVVCSGNSGSVIASIPSTYSNNIQSNGIVCSLSSVPSIAIVAENGNIQLYGYSAGTQVYGEIVYILR